MSARRGVWVLPKYLGGVPGDKLITPPWMPRGLRLFLSRRFLGKNLGTMEGYGLPKPDHRPFEAHPSASGEFLGRAGSGDISFKPAITKLDGKQVHFADGTAEDVDVVICATGYNISFPFFSDPNLLPDKDNRFPLFKRMMKPGIDNLFFMGLAQPMPTLVNFAEQQSKLVAAYLTGKYQLPSANEMQEITKADEAYFLAPYYKSPRHTIQLEFDPYVRNMNKEIAKGTQACCGLREQATCCRACSSTRTREGGSRMSLVNGHCDNEFDAVRTAFEAQLESGEELGGSVAITVDGESVVDLWGGYADESPYHSMGQRHHRQHVLHHQDHDGPVCAPAGRTRPIGRVPESCSLLARICGKRQGRHRSSPPAVTHVRGVRLGARDRTEGHLRPRGVHRSPRYPEALVDPGYGVGLSRDQLRPSRR